MFNQIKNTLVLASSNLRFKIVVQLIIFALLLIASLIQADGVLANPSWGSVGGEGYHKRITHPCRLISSNL